MILYVHISPSNKLYFGITKTDPKVRWGSDGHKYKGNTYFYRAIQKYGWDNFKHIILIENLSKEMACECEKYLIAKYRSNESDYGYNISSGGECSALGMKHTEETKQHLHNVFLNRSVSAETRKKLGDIHRGKHLSDETKQKISNSLKGKPLKEETKQKISEHHKMSGRFRGENNPMYNNGSLVSGEKNGMFGKHHSEETKELLSTLNKGERNHFYGKHHSEETRLKLSQAHMGKKLGKQSEEHIRKRVEARKRTLELKKLND